MAKPSHRPISEKYYTTLIVALTVLINAVVLFLFFMPKFQGSSHFDLSFLPMLNAVFNSFTTVFLLAALYFIKKKNIRMHRRFIYAAFSSTALFLVSYLTYHAMAPSTHFGGEGWIRPVYYFVLVTHIILAAPTVFLALFTIIRGLHMQVEKHRKIARWTMPIWIYVSITGVLVYLLISPYY
ncbi:DUF420 domain-containing protein [Thermoactinomyces mirandus]|uniref:DUF420 domain-containing protein n=1 Tax=Thermoactinomyces mirandus TaxID=2756294 RepID=A0A7W1XQX4_9BACL|nr:DUF420 domain-containing protein [Thermoactinomyces mirandus]MBA4601647.1 DUF420 domain-containing protein [Thermoactinomyces mirandus]